ncbi:sulfatase-like hydrolase/transferase [Micrococcales bacterium 31B]|nr:sulfatase-like hydrolase/transferase [Micrococcales bacterium 31B]
MQPTVRPNFVCILTDDQGPWARGRTMPELITPTLDALGAGGLELTRFFCSSPVCSPARASLVTGRMPSAHGVHDWIRCENSGVSTRGINYLQNFETTPELLARAGYACGHSGKWHLGDARHAAPGFSHWYAHRDGGGPYYGAPVVSGSPGALREHTEPGYFTEAVTRHALAQLGGLTASGRPFYLQVHYTAPHGPWSAEHHPRELRALYSDCDWESLPPFQTVDEMHPWFDNSHWGLGTRAARHDALVGFSASMTGVDNGVRDLVAELDRLGVRDNTYLVFMSDNGFNVGHHGIWGKGNGTRIPNMYDESVMVPFFINGPGVTPRLDKTLTSGAQWHRTLLDLAGVAPNDDPLCAGESFAGLIRGEASAPPEPIVMYDEYGGTRMIRTETHKYVWRHGDAPHELYDLVEDPGEEVNRADEPSQSGLRDDLYSALRDWFAAHSDARYDAAARPVAGFGQDHPVWVPLADESHRYAQQPTAPYYPAPQ